MIVSRIFGGLGNQLFQYAAGYALAAKNQTILKLDLTAFDKYTRRNFELGGFDADFSIATLGEIKRLKAYTSVQRIASRLTPYRFKRFYKQPGFGFDSSFFSLRQPVYIQGYFQSEKFFTLVEEALRQTLIIQNPFREEIEKTAERLRNTASVAVHIRRGDYKNVEALKLHGMLPSAYYKAAAQVISEKQGENLTFYLFSDDPLIKWEEFLSGNVERISGIVTSHHLEDFYLMQQCRHNIIANSSFSWWAAWLNRYTDKIVIAPKTWFANGPEDIKDLYPHGWLRL